MAPTSMLAAVYHPGNENLVIDKAYPIRALKANEVLLKVSACGGWRILGPVTHTLI